MLLSKRHLLLISFCSVLCFLAAGIVRMEYLSSTVQVLLPDVLGQLRGLSENLLLYFILLPLLPTVYAYRLLDGHLPFPRLAGAAWALFLLGIGLLGVAFAGGGIESGWMYAVGSAVTRDSVSASFLTGLLLSCVALQLVSINLLIGFQRPTGATPLVRQAFLLSAGLMLFALPFVEAALVLALGQKLLGPGLGDSSGSFSLLSARLYAFAHTPLHAAMLLPALSLPASALLQREPARFLRPLLTALALLSIPAVDQGLTAGMASPFLSLASAFYHSMLALTLLLFVGALLHQAFARDGQLLASVKPSQLYAGAAVSTCLLYGPVGLAINTLGLSDVFAPGYLNTVHHGLLLLLLFLALLSALSAEHEAQASLASSPTPIRVALGVLGLTVMMTLVPLLLLGRSAVPATVTAYPAELEPLQLAATLGGSLLLIAVLLNIVVARLQLRDGAAH